MKRNEVTMLRNAMVVVGLLILCGVATLGVASEKGLDEADAIALVRQLNTAEIEIFSAKDGNHQYVPLREVLDSPRMNSWGKVVTRSDDNSGTIQGYTLSVIASDDGQHFLLSLAPKTCGRAIFSNESGVIYLGQAAGCE